jgi:stage II sporulation protein D
LDSEVLGIEIAERSQSRRVLQLTVTSERGQMEISGKDFRRLLGYDFLRSTNFMVQKKDGGYLFSGRGWGHGVGLCQWGAKGMAEKGMDYHSILKYYYRDVEVRKIPRRKPGSVPVKP